MKTFSIFLGVVFALALLLAIMAGGYFLFKYLVELLGALEPQVKTISVIASVVALLFAAIIAGGLKAYRKIENSPNAIDQKRGIYVRLLSYLSDQLRLQMAGNELTADNDLSGFEQRLVLYGSPEVLRAYVNLRRESMNGGRPGQKVASLLNNLVMEMRGDLGQTEWRLKENDLFDLMVGPK